MTVASLDLVNLCQAIYIDGPQGWDHYWTAGGVVCGHKLMGEDSVLVFRGSVTAADWMKDADAFPVWDGEVGHVHAGFLEGVDAVLAEVQKAIGPTVTSVTGHSLGGANARVAGAKMLVRGWKLGQIMTFGSPKPAFANLSRIIQKSAISHLSYRNRNDPVPLVPGILPWWTHPEPWHALDSAPGTEDLDPLRDHFIARYIEGITAMASSS